MKHLQSTLLPKKFDKEFYSTGTYSNYLSRFQKEGQDYARRIKENLKPKFSWKFLDVGCGMGGIVLSLRKLGFQAWGTEISPYCLKSSPARKWLKVASTTKLPFKDQSFEVVLCIDVLYYLTKRQRAKAIKELSRVTRNYLYIETVCKGSLSANQKRNPDPLRKNKHLPTVKELKKLFAQSQALFLKPLFKKGEIVNLGSSFKPIKKIDFNGFFIKSSTPVVAKSSNLRIY